MTEHIKAPLSRCFSVVATVNNGAASFETKAGGGGDGGAERQANLMRLINYAPPRCGSDT